MTEWFDTFFDALAHDVWDALVPADASDQEAEWLAARLELAGSPGRKLLDVPSGRGRLAVRIAARLHEVVAVDCAEVSRRCRARSAPGCALPGRRGDRGRVAPPAPRSGRPRPPRGRRHPLTNSHHYDAPRSMLVTRMVLERGGERAERTVEHRVMTCREVVDALARAGFELERIDGDLDGSGFDVGAGRCLITAVRNAEAAPG